MLGPPKLPKLAQSLLRLTAICSLAYRSRMEQRQRARPLRVRRRIQRRHRASLMRSQNDRTRRTDSIEHSSQVLHAGFQGRKMGAIIGKPRPTLIEQDQTKRAGKTLVKLTPIPRLPPVHQIRHVIGDIHEVHLAGTDDLVRDRDTRATRIPNLSLHDKHLPRVWPHQQAPLVSVYGTAAGSVSSRVERERSSDQ
jgi:hypothetical protein